MEAESSINVLLGFLSPYDLADYNRFPGFEAQLSNTYQLALSPELALHHLLYLCSLICIALFPFILKQCTLSDSWLFAVSVLRTQFPVGANM